MSARQRGAAIVLALSVVALATLAATAMMVSQGVWIRQIELSAGRTQGHFVIQAGLDWARAVLSHDRQTSNVDHPGEPWAVRLSPITVENGSVAGYLEDGQARFNLNNLLKNGVIDPAQLAAFGRLLTILGLQAGLADRLADWMEIGGRPLVDASELARLDCFDEAVRRRLGGFVTALPRATTVNVNTAAPEVLAAAIEGLSLDDARALVAQRERAYFRSTAEFLDRLPRSVSVSSGSVAVRSDYFMATIHASFRGAHARSLALLAHGESGGWPAIVWRKYL
jgi:general secretion pathway protein K